MTSARAAFAFLTSRSTKARERTRESLAAPLVRLSVTLTLCFALSVTAAAQGVQVIRGVADQTTIVTTSIPRDSILIDVTARRERYTRMLMSQSVQRDAPAYAAIVRAESEANRVLAARNDPREFVAALNSFRAAEEGVFRIMDRPSMSELIENREGFRPFDIPAPAITTAVPDVVFVVGGDVTRLRAPERGSVFSLGVATNLLGAAVGSAFDALGSSTLKDYFSNNISIGPAVPTSGPHKISSQLGLGLGEVRIGPVTLWPDINLEQLDTADLRVPPDVISKKPSEQSWSVPSFGLGVPLGKTFLERVKAGKLVAILTFGYKVPYYFPGDSFTALGALFSTRRNDYVRRGPGTFSVGLSVPLLKVKPST